MEVAKSFIVAHGLSEDAYEDVRNFILTAKEREGAGVRAAKARASQSRVGSSFAHVPTRVYADFSTVDFKKVWPKLLELNASLVGVAGASSFSSDEEAALRAVVDVLENTARYHASTVPRRGVGLAVRACAAWPLTHLLPVLDVLRVCVLHPDGAAAVAATPGFLAALLRVVRSAAAPSAGADVRPAALVSGRLLANCFRHAPTRTMLEAAVPEALDAAALLVRYSAASSVRCAGAYVLHNLARLAHDAGSDFARLLPSVGSQGGALSTAVGLVCESLGALPRATPPATGIAESEHDACYKLLLASGTLLLLDASSSRGAIAAAKAVGLSATLEALALSPSTPLSSAAAEVQQLLALPVGL